MRKDFLESIRNLKEIRRKGQGNRFITKYNIHVITRNNVEQEGQKSVRSDVVIPNELGNGDTCQGLRHWRLLPNLKNNFSKPVRNDMDNNSRSTLLSLQLNRLDCFAFARNDRGRHPEGTRAEDVRREPYPFNASVKNPKDLSTQSHVITRNNVEQELQKLVRSDVVIPNKLGNGEACKGLLRRFVRKITNNDEISPHNDMKDKILNQVQDDSVVVVQNNVKDKKCKRLINLSTYRLIDFKKILRLKPQDDVTNLFPYFPISLSPKKLRRFRIKSGMTFIKQPAFTLAETLITLGIVGVVAAMTIPNLMENVRNRDLQVQLKKTYSEWNQISMQFMNDHEQSIPDFVAEKGNGVFFNEIPKYLKGVSKFSNWIYDSNDEDGSNITTTPYKIYTLRGTRTVMACDVSGFRNDIAGKYILFDDAPKSGRNGPRLCIDINGDKKPNKIGLDIFYFLFTTDGHIIPEGADHLDNDYTTKYYVGGTLKAESKYCNGNIGENSLACTYYAINDKSPKGNGTYWKDFIGGKQYK